MDTRESWIRGLASAPTLVGLGAALALAAGVTLAHAQTTVRMLHVDSNAATQELWDQAATDFEAANPGVDVDIQYLENEAYKAKLPTLLQSDEKPNIIYSWSGGVMRAQDEAGYLADVTEGASGWTNRFSAGAAAAFNIDGRIVGAPNHLSEVVFFYNKELVAEAGVNPDEIETWDAFLAAVQTIKDAGITPIVVGAGEKWPMHFYWSYLVMRIGGADAALPATPSSRPASGCRSLPPLSRSRTAGLLHCIFRPPAFGATATARSSSWGAGSSTRSATTPRTASASTRPISAF